KRRRFSAEYKAMILAAYDAAEPGEKGALLRREGLYSSHLVDWRRARDAGAAGGLAAQPRTGERSSEQAESDRLRRDNERLQKELAQTRAALDVVGKAHALLGSPRARTPTSRRAGDRTCRRRPGGAHLGQAGVRPAGLVAGHPLPRPAACR
ncbi:MAG TPA: hypothetical protein VF635_16450, partial [Propionibacteriaceae bacterium]